MLNPKYPVLRRTRSIDSGSMHCRPTFSPYLFSSWFWVTDEKKHEPLARQVAPTTFIDPTESISVAESFLPMRLGFLCS